MSEEETYFLPEIAVVQYCVCDVLYERKKQKIKLHGCVTTMFASIFYGEYSIYDEKDRLLGTSNNGTFSWMRKDLQTEEAKVWYDCISNVDEQYKTLYNMLQFDPGFGFKHMSDIYIEFHDAPDAEKEPDRIFDHIHIIYTSNNIWNQNKKEIIYKN